LGLLDCRLHEWVSHCSIIVEKLHELINMVASAEGVGEFADKDAFAAGIDSAAARSPRIRGLPLRRVAEESANCEA
ncbi:MAG TPA: hypothetical protein VKL19_03835, partial [Thermoanaerobaculia bacterium]|nr:hypothetical protein [Thermoanaerobaculia bacterium]